jgi:hypothetical protein
LEPTFRRGHGSLYKALTRGGLDADRLRDTLVAHRPADWLAIFAVDASSWPRCDADPPKSTKPGTGRSQGTLTGPRTRYPAIKKSRLTASHGLNRKQR